jgi:hypothetical protein
MSCAGRGRTSQGRAARAPCWTPLLIATLLLASRAGAADLARATEESRFEQQVHQLFWNDHFDELDAIAASARRDRSRFDDGRWKLAIVYGALGGIPTDASDAKIADAKTRLADWRHKHPESPTPVVALAQFMLSEAWKARGGKLANEVTQAQWQGFAAKLKETHDLLDTTKPVAAACPGWWDAMLTLSRAESWKADRATDLFHQAVAKEPLYQAFYFNRIQSLQPRWGGSLAQIVALADEAVELTKSVEGRTMHARVLWAACQYEGTKPLEDGTFDWKKMKGGFEDLMARYPESDRNLHAFARWSWAAGDKATAASIFRKLGDDWYSDIWGNRDRYDFARKWALEGA